ncbi:MAG: hypothetical protein KAJ88_04935 [Candidatus Aenigmarchaeota archaeon]|nr:hypothetical protein [Candidatus Aenigmarchaeota archaeon]MCK5235165.1 hypothetical protein [Candidatus Aenigmarchaeota archaeon]
MKTFLIKAKIAMDRGKYWLSYINFAMLLFIAVTSMKEYEYFSFLQGRYWLVLLGFGTLVFITVLGYVDLKKLKTYQVESEIYARINPVQQKIFENQDKILKRIEGLEKKIGKK